MGTNLIWCSILLSRNESPIVAINETTKMIRSCNPKCPKASELMVSFNAIKIKKQHS